jgi:predicted DNA-binding protein YlxM (UPF0122 family)
MKLIICNSCGLEKKSHAKNMCKSCYCKSDFYKELRKVMDKKYQTENKLKIYETRKLRRRSQTYKESDDYVITLIGNTFKISRQTINKFPDVLQSKKNELKIKRNLKQLKNV